MQELTLQDYDKIQNTEFKSNDLGIVSIRAYLHQLLTALWNQGEGFSSKRPFGNSSWEYDLLEGIAKAGYFPYEEDELGYIILSATSRMEAEQLVFGLIDYIFFGEEK